MAGVDTDRHRPGRAPRRAAQAGGARVPRRDPRAPARDPRARHALAAHRRGPAPGRAHARHPLRRRPHVGRGHGRGRRRSRSTSSAGRSATTTTTCDDETGEQREFEALDPAEFPNMTRMIAEAHYLGPDGEFEFGLDADRPRPARRPASQRTGGVVMLDVLKTRDYRLLWIGQGDLAPRRPVPPHRPAVAGAHAHARPVPARARAGAGRHPARRGHARRRRVRRPALAARDHARLGRRCGSSSPARSPSRSSPAAVQLWMVYVLALSFGVVSGFFMPAAEASLPRLLRDEQLEGGNALMMGADQLDELRRAGARRHRHRALRRVAGRRRQAGSLTGVGVAFAVDAALVRGLRG